jgi:hypothetical protein
MVPFDAIWDTGATHSVITQAVADACGLSPTGTTLVQHVEGSAQAETYLINIGLPNGVGYSGIRVTKGKPVGGDILIGMDVISTGDFSVTNFGGITKFTFRHPSVGHIDFVQESRTRQFHHGGKPKANRSNTGGRKTKGKKNR